MLPDNTLLMALATSQNQVRICRVHIQWTQPQKDGQGKIANPILSPAIVVEHLTSINCMETTLSEELHHISQPASSISHLRILPPTDVTQPGQLKHPNLITVRTHLPQSSSQYPQESESVVDKWELSESINALHPAFEQLGQAAGNRKGSTDARATVRFVNMWIVNIC